MVLQEFFRGFPYVSMGLLVIAAYFLYTKLKRPAKIQEMFKAFSCPPEVPVLGNGLVMNVPSEDIMDAQFEWHRKYGNRVIVHALNTYYMVLTEPSDLEELFSSSAHIEKGALYDLIKPWLAQGLLTSGGTKWQKRRKMLTPTFHFKILEDFLVIFNEQAQIFLEVLTKDFDQGKINDICPYVARCTLDIICQTAMDQKINAQQRGNSPYVEAVNTACKAIIHRFLRPWFWPDWIFALTPTGWRFRSAIRTLHAFTDKVIQERKSIPVRSRRDSNRETSAASEDFYWKGKPRLAFLDLLIEAQKNPENDLTDQDIREEVDTFMFEGQDTTAANINWTLFMLALHPQYQAKVQEELDGIFGDDRKRSITAKDLGEMKYLEICIKETLRLFPSVPVMARRLTQDLVLSRSIKLASDTVDSLYKSTLSAPAKDGAVIPAGVSVAICSMLVHYNPKVFPDPEAFKPERFLPENSAGRHPYAYIPFSAGPRNCIGQKFAMMEEKVILAKVFRHFKVEACDKREDVQIMIEVITRPRDGLKMRLIPREIVEC